ncbi:hypothetical protein EHJ14_04785 [Cronobacter sakazakii]|nr:hypothetical protein [Cronobacter sakazakii]PQY64301.1 hypothetical protein C5942_07935 [Cronobacter sakazakii]
MPILITYGRPPRRAVIVSSRPAVFFRRFCQACALRHARRRLRRTRGLRFRRPDMIRRYQFEIILTLLLLCGALSIFFYW